MLEKIQKNIIEAKDFITDRTKNLKMSFSVALKLGLLVPGVFAASEIANAQNSNETLFKAIRANENNINEINFDQEREKDTKPAFVLAGESELINFLQNSENQDSIYNKTQGIDDAAAGVVGTLILNSSKTEDFYWLANNPSDFTQIMKQRDVEENSGLFDKSTIVKAELNNADYYVVLSKTDTEYKASIFDVKQGLIDVIKVADNPSLKFTEEMSELAEVVGNRISTLK